MDFERIDNGRRRMDAELLRNLSTSGGHGILVFAQTLERIKKFEAHGLLIIESLEPLTVRLTDTGKRGLAIEWRWYLEQRIRDEERQIEQLSRNRAMWVERLEEHNRQLLDRIP